MCAAKRKSPPSLWSGRLIGAGRPVLVVAILAGPIAGGWHLTWKRFGPRILSSPEYMVGPEQVEINPPPPWIHSDVRAAAFHHPTLDGPLSLMDDTLVERIRSAFKELPWVAGVRTVVKRHPASAHSVTVELDYRQPVCMVEAPGGVHAIDAEGVLLPREDFTPNEAACFLRLSGVDQPPTGPAGRRWNDPRVAGGAEIAAALAGVWEKMKLYRIEARAGNAAEVAPSEKMATGTSRQAVLPLPSAASSEPVSVVSQPPTGLRAAEPMFALQTRAGSQISWGYAPGAKVAGEPTVDEKVAWLRRYFDQYDSLDGPQGQAQRLDVRTLGQAAGRQ